MDFFLFWRVKRELAGLSLDEASPKKTWEWIARTITAAEFTAAEFTNAFRR